MPKEEEMNTLCKLYCNVNCWCIYDWIRPKIRFCLFFLDRYYKFKISHKLSTLTNMFIFRILNIYLSEEEKSKCWWIYKLGRTKEEWSHWYSKQKQRRRNDGFDNR